MKKRSTLIIAAALALALLSGCAAEAANAYAPKDDILTYEGIDPEKTQITVSRTGNIPVMPLVLEFEAKNPDIQVIYMDITGGDSNYAPAADWIENGYAPDIVMSAAQLADAEATVKYFQNLSGDPIIDNYEASALQRTATGSEIYWLPGPSDISAMMYNKTLFEKYGWEVPNTFDEFIALCDRIREDTAGAIEPWNPNAKYSNELTTALEAFTYEELFAGLENREWYEGIASGESAEFSAHMKPYTDVLKTLIDHGILTSEHFAYSATARGKEFAAGSIAMINMSVYDADSAEFDFGYMPFPTTSGELGYLCDRYSCFLGIVAKERTDEQQEAVKRFVEYFSSEEGQKAYIGETIKVSNVKGVSFNETDDLAALLPAIKAGHMFALLEFRSEAGVQSKVFLHQLAIDLTEGTMTDEDALLAIDKRLAEAEEPGEEEAPKVLAKATEDFTVLETSYLIADAYREAADAEIGLVANNAVYRGNLMRVFEGDITENMVAVFKPRSFANDSALVKAQMTGAELMEALNNPLGDERVENCIYACSGLKLEVNPWKPLGEKYISVKLESGAALEEDRLYTVAFWQGTVSEEYITNTVETFEGTWEEMMTKRLESLSEITPDIEGRIKLTYK